VGFGLATAGHSWPCRRSKSQDIFWTKKIGKGSYATVWKGHVESGGADDVVAVKVISRQTVTETTQLRQEVEVLRRISHTNIVRFRDLKKSASHFYLVLEFCAGGDLSQFLRERGKVVEDMARNFLTQIAAGICMLHQENVLHRDLKPQNILLSDPTESPVLKIADFGFARALQPQDMAATVCGSPLYMAPEILRHEKYDAKADLWSVGAILYELLLGRPPYNGANPMQLLANIEKSTGVSFDGAQISDDGQGFLRELLMRLPGQRLSSAAFARHAYVRLGPLPDAKDSVTHCTEGIVYANDGSSLMGGAVPTWSGADSPLVASPIIGSPREAGDDSPPGSFHLNGLTDDVAVPPVGAMVEAHSLDSAALNGVRGKVRGFDGEHVRVAIPFGGEMSIKPSNLKLVEAADAAEPSSRLGTDAVHTETNDGLAVEEQSPRRRFEEEYVVLTEQGPPISAWAKGRQRGSGGGTDLCGNLSRIAHSLEQLALRQVQQFPSDALALLLRALALLEKALKLSIAEEGTCEPLREAFRRMLQAAEVAALQIQTPAQCGSEAMHGPARPNYVIFEFAVQQAKDAAVALSKGHEVGGWETFCHEKLTLALLLLDLLGSEAEGEDLTTISSYTAPITRLVGEIERLDQSRGSCGQDALGLAMEPGHTPPLMGC